VTQYRLNNHTINVLGTVFDTSMNWNWPRNKVASAKSKHCGNSKCRQRY